VIRNEVSFRINKPVGEVFSFVDDVSQTPRWLSRCVSIDQTSPGPRGVGTQLHYTHSTGSMDGVVTDYEKDRRLGMSYTDRMFDVLVDFWFAPENGSTAVRHATEINPKSLVGKLMSPFIRVGIRRQMAKDTQTLKRLLEEPH
jgi:ribosome-associated toxin RatA of RatAB toxin-antitoxin module